MAPAFPCDGRRRRRTTVALVACLAASLSFGCATVRYRIDGVAREASLKVATCRVSGATERVWLDALDNPGLFDARWLRTRLTAAADAPYPLPPGFAGPAEVTYTDGWTEKLAGRASWQQRGDHVCLALSGSWAPARLLAYGPPPSRRMLELGPWCSTTCEVEHTLMR
jgi:hypothetical protein